MKQWVTRWTASDAQGVTDDDGFVPQRLYHGSSICCRHGPRLEHGRGDRKNDPWAAQITVKKLSSLSRPKELKCESIVSLEYGDKAAISSNSTGKGGGECPYSISVSGCACQRVETVRLSIVHNSSLMMSPLSITTLNQIKPEPEPDTVDTWRHVRQKNMIHNTIHNIR